MRLPARERAIVCYASIIELAQGDISANLGIRLSGSKKRMYRAVEQADQALAETIPAGV